MLIFKIIMVALIVISFFVIEGIIGWRYDDLKNANTKKEAIIVSIFLRLLALAGLALAWFL